MGLGSGRHLRGFREPVVSTLVEYQPKQSHMDLFQPMFDDFVHFPSILQPLLAVFWAKKFAIVPLESFNNLRDLIT